MLQLKETTHDYYCNIGEGSNTKHFSEWNSFKEFRGLDWFNEWLLFRYDLFQNDDGNWYLLLHYVGQYHGIEQFHAVVNNICEENLPEINDYLKNSCEYLFKMWEEVT